MVRLFNKVEETIDASGFPLDPAGAGFNDFTGAFDFGLGGSFDTSM